MTKQNKLFERYCKKKDNESLKKLIIINKPWLLKLLYRIVGDNDVAYDLMQDTWIRVLNKCDNFNAKSGNINNYLYTVAKNEALKWKSNLQNMHGSKGFYKTINFEKIDGNFDSPEDIIMINEHCNGIKNAIMKLSKDYQDVILLYYFASLSVNEIASIIEKPQGTVKSLLQRGREKLKFILPDFIEIEYAREYYE